LFTFFEVGNIIFWAVGPLSVVSLCPACDVGELWPHGRSSTRLHASRWNLVWR